MISSIEVSSTPVLRKQLQNRLFSLAVGFLFLYCTALTLAPLAKNHTWSGELVWKPWIGFASWVICYYFVQRFSNAWMKNYDPFILPIMYILIGWGNLTIWRLSSNLGSRQSIWIIIGSAVLLLVIRIPNLLDILAKYRYVWMAVCFVLVGFTLLPGFTSDTSQPNLWLSIGSLNIQPSEPLKLFLVVYLAAYFSNHLTVNPRSLSVLLPSLVVILITTSLLVMQRDLGTASLILMLYTFTIYTVTRKKRVLLIAGIILIVSCIAGFFTIDVIRLRFEAWINPWIDPTNRSYQIVQSLIALAAGGFLGTGPGMGAPFLVPVAASDFVFSSIVEETGLLGGTGLVVLIFLLYSRSIRAAQKAENPFGALLAGGLGLLSVFQSILIIGGNIRVLPLTGVTLPLMSYGGSSLLVSMTALGLILRISDQTPKSILAVPVFDALRTQILTLVTVVFIAIFALLPVWTIIQRDSFLQRGDNLRHSLNDTYVKRGTIRDRNDRPINTTSGETGSYSRDYLYPDLTGTVGYAHPVYGLSGIESSLDSTLRGSSGYPVSQLWWNNLLTSQTPPGLDIRLSLDLDIQQTLDQELTGLTGAGVILNANSGEILAISSQPHFSPADLDQNWDSLVGDPDLPLLNRAINGQYPVGTANAVFLYALSLENNLQLKNFTSAPVVFDEKQAACAISLPADTTSLTEMLKYSCPQISLNVARLLGKENLYQYYSQLGWYQVPSIPLPENPGHDPGEIENLKTAAVGQENLAITPLQMALSATTISAGGIKPSPKLVISTQTPDGQWQLAITDSTTQKVFSKSTSLNIQQLTQIPDLPAWGVIGKGISGMDKTITWFVGGTTQDWNGSQLTLVFVLEEDNPQLALDTGKNLLTQLLIH